MSLTRLHKPVQRVVHVDGRAVVVRLRPDGIITVRLLRAHRDFGRVRLALPPAARSRKERVALAQTELPLQYL